MMELKMQINLGAESRVTLMKPASVPSQRSLPVDGMSRGAEDEKLVIISFVLGDAEYAFIVTEAVEVLKPRRITWVPRMPEFLIGIFSLRGEMVPIFDLKKRLILAMSRAGAHERILITVVDDVKAGFVVDRLCGIEEVPAKALETLDIGGSVAAVEFFKGIIRVNGREIRLLNTSRLIDMGTEAPLIR